MDFKIRLPSLSLSLSRFLCVSPLFFCLSSISLPHTYTTLKVILTLTYTVKHCTLSCVFTCSTTCMSHVCVPIHLLLHAHTHTHTHAHARTRTHTHTHAHTHTHTHTHLVMSFTKVHTLRKLQKPHTINTVIWSLSNKGCHMTLPTQHYVIDNGDYL